MSIDRYELSGSIDKKRSSLSGDVPAARVITGASAYEIAKANGFVGTEEAWLESLKGRPGDPGKKGDDYILTEEDKKEIAVEAAKLVDISDIPGGGSVDLTGYAKEEWVKENFQPKGNYLTEHQSLEGYAKTSEIPKKPEDIGAQPAGNYALKTEIPSVPVQSVNGKTGAVVLDASAVGARPSTWMPTYSDVGAEKSGTAGFQVAAHNTSTTSHNDIRQELQAINDRLSEVPSGGGGEKWELIDHVVVEEDVTSFDLDFDKAYKSLYVSWRTVAGAGTNYWVAVKPPTGNGQFYFNSTANSTRNHAFRIDCGLGWFEFRGIANDSGALAPFQKVSTGNHFAKNMVSMFSNKGLDENFSATTGIKLNGSTFSLGTELYVYGIPA